MSQKSRCRLTGGAVTFLVALLILVPQATLQRAGVTGAAMAEATSEPSAELQEQAGIKVHGHWTIEVRNPDGSLASRTEFDNALAASGPQFLAQILGRKNTPGEWSIELLGTACGGGTCWILESWNPNTFAYPYFFKTLSVAKVATVPQQKLELRGVAFADQAGQITAVNSATMMCPPTLAPSAACSMTQGAVGTQVTSHTLATPVSVAAGQAVQVTVVISFS